MLDNLGQARECERVGHSEDCETESDTSSGSFHSTVESLEPEVYSDNNGLIENSLALLALFGYIQQSLNFVEHKCCICGYKATLLYQISKNFHVVKSSDTILDLNMCKKKKHIVECQNV